MGLAVRPWMGLLASVLACLLGSPLGLAPLLARRLGRASLAALVADPILAWRRRGGIAPRRQAGRRRSRPGRVGRSATLLEGARLPTLRRNASPGSAR